MGFKKYARKQLGKAKKYLKKRYVPHGKIDVERVVKDVAYVKSMLNVETKYRDVVQGNTTISIDGANWVITRLNQIPKGDNDDQRNGSSCRIKSLQIRGKAELTASLPNSYPSIRVRVVIFMDREVNLYNIGAYPSATELYTDNSINSMRSWESLKMKRFSILKTFYIKLTNDAPERLLSYYRKMHMPVKWTSGDTTGENITQHPIYIAFSSDTVNLQQVAPVYSLQTRLTYVDN